MFGSIFDELKSVSTRSAFNWWWDRLSPKIVGLHHPSLDWTYNTVWGTSILNQNAQIDEKWLIWNTHTQNTCSSLLSLKCSLTSDDGNSFSREPIFSCQANPKPTLSWCWDLYYYYYVEYSELRLPRWYFEWCAIITEGRELRWCTEFI